MVSSHRLCPASWRRRAPFTRRSGAAAEPVLARMRVGWTAGLAPRLAGSPASGKDTMASGLAASQDARIERFPWRRETAQAALTRLRLPIATPAQYVQMLDAARDGRYA